MHHVLPSAFDSSEQEAAPQAAVEGRLALLAAMTGARTGQRPGDLGSGALLRFKSLMAGEGLPCDLARLVDDRHYAYERVAAAHATASEPLRRLALELFQIFQARESGLPTRQ